MDLNEEIKNLKDKHTYLVNENSTLKSELLIQTDEVEKLHKDGALDQNHHFLKKAEIADLDELGKLLREEDKIHQQQIQAIEVSRKNDFFRRRIRL